MLQLLPQELAIGFRVILDVVLDEFDPVPVFLFQLIDDGLLLDAGRSGGTVEIDMLRFAAGCGNDTLGFDVACDRDLFLVLTTTRQGDQKREYRDRSEDIFQVRTSHLVIF